MWIFTPLDTFHFPFVHTDASAQLMESVVAVHFCQKIEDMSHVWITIWKLAATLLCPNLQVTQRIYSAMQISREEIAGSVQQVCLEAHYEAKNILFQCFKCSFIYLIGHTEVASGWLRKLSPWKWLYIKAFLTYSSLLWGQISAKGAQTQVHNYSASSSNIFHPLINSNWNTSAEYPVIS